MIRAIGFEGVPGPQRQPARLAGIFVDEDNCRVTWKGNGFRRMSNRTVTHLPASSTTRIEPPIEAIVDSAFLVLDSRDLEVWQAAAFQNEPPNALPGPEKVRDQMRAIGGMCHAWLCTPPAALRVLGVLRDAAIWDLSAALAKSDDIRVYELAWRVHRCAVNDDDIFIVAAALEQSIHPDRATDLLKGHFYEMPPTAQESALSLARTRLDALKSLVP
jgi:hypothetical protein